jgi:hypothetical protein
MKTVPAWNVPDRLTAMLAAPLIWFGHFTVIGGFAHLAPALGLAPGDIRSLCWIATAFALGAIAAFLWHDEPDAGRDTEDPTALYATELSVLSVIAVLLQTFVLAIVP